MTGISKPDTALREGPPLAGSGFRHGPAECTREQRNERLTAISFCRLTPVIV